MLIISFQKENQSKDYNIYTNPVNQSTEPDEGFVIVKKVSQNENNEIDNNSVKQSVSDNSSINELNTNKTIKIDDDEITIVGTTSSLMNEKKTASDVVLTESFLEYYKNKIILKELPHKNDAQFDVLMNEILEFIYNKYSCFTTGIAWKKKSGNIEIKYKKSNTVDLKNTFIELNDCLLSSIIKNGIPVVRNQIETNQEKDLLTYYTDDYYHNIKSFGGVPIYFNNQVVGALFVDFKIDNVITQTLIDDLASYSKLISYFIIIYNNRSQKDDYKDKFYHLLELLDNNFLNFDQHIINKFAKSLLAFIEYDFMSIVFLDVSDNQLKVKYTYNNTPNKYPGPGNIIEKNSICSDCIYQQTDIFVENLENSNYIYRFNKEENINFNGSIIAVPIIAEDVYGCILIENTKKNFYNRAHLTFIKQLMGFWGNLIALDIRVEILKKNVEYDTEFEVLTLNKFYDRVQLELEKNILLGNVNCSVAIIRIDYSKYPNDFGGSLKKLPVKFLIKNTKPHLKKYDLIGIYDSDKIIVYFFNMDSQKALITLEKIRLDISRNQYRYNNKEYLFTITAGLVNSTGKASLENIISDAIVSLEQGLQKGGNNIQRIDS
ncbi:MAG TPA: GAF domain-containing protein [Ignavibacteriales bacterium]|nr:GAF domain-containing protein [Ignavibacteriales bacterium]HOL80150.1 GAF domain-containing protein [Ignavibacteriales bacterium]HOM64432.1 GAF domain-containing protein [Ignavibacteriales bacterium]HPD67919.1 GAF domain-containing protein [Ignavibacteriales bacterium]HPP32339.1 GAF domain-containing protein [Ignavibacteriales bacterium]